MTQDTANKRTQQRSRCLKEGKIAFGNGTFVVDCIIDIVSGSGAHVKVQGTSPLPKEFLLVEAARAMVHKAKIVRRTPRGFGVKLNGVFEDSQASEAYLRRFRR